MRPRILLAVLFAGASAVLSAQAPTTTSTQVTTLRAAPPSGFRTDYLAEIDAVGKKLVELAEAMPADKYSWRPAPGVRSVGEVYLHVVGGNSFIPTFLGAPPMEGVSRETEKTVKDKAQIVALLKKSIENARAVAANVPEADLNKKVKAFGGREMSERQVLLILLNHLHEHLGQSIAYARSNGVTPPWSTSD